MPGFWKSIAFCAVAALAAPVYAAAWTDDLNQWQIENPVSLLSDFNSESQSVSFNNFPVSIGNIGLSVSNPGYNADGLTNRLILTPTDDEIGGFYSFDGSNYIVVDLVPYSYLTISLQNNAMSFGANLVGIANLSRQSRVEILDRNDQAIDFTMLSYPDGDPSQKSFVGVTSDSPFKSIRFTMTPESGRFPINDVFGLDNIRISYFAPVPEPSIWASMLIGFAFVGAGLRRARVQLIGGHTSTYG